MLRGFAAAFAAAAPAMLLATGTASAGAPQTTARASLPQKGKCMLGSVGADSFCTASDGTRLHLVDWGGNGPAILLLAGLGNSARIFDELAPMLAKGHRVIALTRRGYGLSADGAGADYGNARMAADVLDVMDALGIARAALVGHSLAGGELARIGKDNPGRVTRLVYLDAAYDRSAVPQIMSGLPAIPPPSDSDRANLAALTRWRAGALGTASPAVRSDLEDVMKPGEAGLVPRTAPAVAQSVLAGDMAAAPDYGAIPAPSLALYTSKDVAEQVPQGADASVRRDVIAYSLKRIRPWMLRAQAQFLEQQKCGVAYEIPDSGHYMFLERPTWTARTILSFLAAPEPCTYAPTAAPARVPAQRD